MQIGNRLRCRVDSFIRPSVVLRIGPQYAVPMFTLFGSDPRGPIVRTILVQPSLSHLKSQRLVTRTYETPTGQILVLNADTLSRAMLRANAALEKELLAAKRVG